MDRLDTLPDELLVKIFQTFREEHLYSCSSDIHHLQFTCKRFYKIINEQLFTIFDHCQYPVLHIGGSFGSRDNPTACDGTVRTCRCCRVRRLANFKFKTCRKLVATVLNLNQDCLLQALVSTPLSPVVELALVSCNFDLFALNSILNAQPSIKRLSFHLEKAKLSTKSKEQLESMKLVRHTLAYLYLNLAEEFLEQDGDILLEYILNYLPARELIITFDNSNPTHLEWIKLYLTQHRQTINCFLFRVNEMNPEVLSIFEDFDHYTEEPKQYPGKFRDKFRIISSGHPRMSKKL